MPAGTVRRGLWFPGAIGAVVPVDKVPLWHRLYLRPLPHQQGSLAFSSRVGAVLTWSRVGRPGTFFVRALLDRRRGPGLSPTSPPTGRDGPRRGIDGGDRQGQRPWQGGGRHTRDDPGGAGRDRSR